MAIMYKHFGGKLAVQAMDWQEFWDGVQLLSEERVGTLGREEAAREDAAFQAVVTSEPSE